MTIDPNTTRAVIYGLACGDALGKDTEFMSVAAIKRRYGSEGIRDLSQTSGQFTDDKFIRRLAERSRNLL